MASRRASGLAKRTNKLHQLQIKARASDLKAYADGTITEAAMKGKIVAIES